MPTVVSPNIPVSATCDSPEPRVLNGAYDATNEAADDGCEPLPPPPPLKGFAANRKNYRYPGSEYVKALALWWVKNVDMFIEENKSMKRM